MRRRRDRNKGALRAEPNLLPMLDVVLQLIVFFMMLVHFGTRLEGANRAIRLPTAPAALPGTDLALDRLAVALDANGGLRIDERAEPKTGDAATAWWADQARRRREGLTALGDQEAAADLSTLVILRADRATPFGDVRRTLQEAQREGFRRFTLVVLREVVEP